MTTSTDFWIALVSAAIVFVDAKRHLVKRPLVWGFAIFIFWIAALPLYLWQRFSSDD